MNGEFTVDRGIALGKETVKQFNKSKLRRKTFIPTTHYIHDGVLYIFSRITSGNREFVYIPYMRILA